MRRFMRAAATLPALLAAAFAFGAPPTWQDDAWLQAAARADGLHLSVSDDGNAWRELPQVFLAPAAGAMRDPYLMRGPDGLFRLVWASDQGIAHASSADLRNWSAQGLIPSPATPSRPVTAWDERAGQFTIGWTAGERAYTVATRDFASFGKPEAAFTATPPGTPQPLWIPPWLAKELAAAQPSATASNPVPAPPPALAGFTADPSIRVFGDTYYLYPTSDKPHWQTTDFSVFSSKNLVDWKKERMILDVTRELRWGTVEAWAPDTIERNGTYYFYFCANQRIGVATANSPLGPFTDPLGKPLIDKGTGLQTNTIDPYPFIDDDGQAYLYYGNGKLGNVYKLKADMVTLDGPVTGIALKDFREGIVVFKRGGKYYFMWSIDDARSPNYRVGWGTADSPLGPVTAAKENFIVLQRNGAAVGTAHHSVVNVPGTDRWYVAYHRHALPQGGGYQRQTVLARMEFDAAGNILPMDPLTSPFRPGDVGEPIVNGKGRADR